MSCQAWVETEYGHHNILNAGGSRTAESSIFSYDDISLSDAGGGNKQESTYLYIQMEYCPRCVSLFSYALRKVVLQSLQRFLFMLTLLRNSWCLSRILNFVMMYQWYATLVYHWKDLTLNNIFFSYSWARNMGYYNHSLLFFAEWEMCSKKNWSV